MFHHPTSIRHFVRRVHIDCTAYASLAGLLASLGQTKAQLVSSLRAADEAPLGQTLVLVDAVDVLLAKDQLATDAFLTMILEVPNIRVLLAARGASTPVSAPRTLLKRFVLAPLDAIASKHLYASLADREPDAAILAQADGLPLALSLLAHRQEGALNC